MSKYFRLTLGRKIYCLIALSFAGCIAVTLFQMRQLRLGLEHQKALELTHLTDIAVGIAREEHAATSKGVSTEEAQKRALARIGAIRYGQNDYFWVNDLQARIVMHPIKPELTGQDGSQIEDPTGKRLFTEFAETVKRQNNGLVSYWWPKPGAAEPQHKLSYVTGFAPWGWVIGSGIYIDDLDAQVWSVARSALSMTAAILLVVLLVSIVVARRTGHAIATVTAATGKLANGDTNVVVPGLGRGDEIGDLADALEIFRDNLIRSDRLRTELAEAEQRAQAERKVAMHQLADSFEEAVGGIVGSVSSASAELESAASILSRTADTTQQLSAMVASASEEASINVQSVAAATDQMTASVGEIARQVHESARIASEAVRQAQATDARIGELSQAASRIGDVVKLITAIAEQTNLLALNATIEAARAGEAGRGFAVVAQEVKALAAQTAKATDEIGAQIGGMQSATRDSVTAIKEIGGTIDHISEIAAAIAAAVEEQGATTAEIARNVQQAAGGTTEVAGNITEVSQGAAETGSASTKVLAAAQALSSEGGKLRSEVARFLATIRAA